jgi:hypothetical protein
VYSPKIDEKHIPALYQLGKLVKKPMTHLVNEAVTEYIASKVKMVAPVQSG